MAGRLQGASELLAAKHVCVVHLFGFAPRAAQHALACQRWTDGPPARLAADWFVALTCIWPCACANKSIVPLVAVGRVISLVVASVGAYSVPSVAAKAGPRPCNVVSSMPHAEVTKGSPAAHMPGVRL